MKTRFISPLTWPGGKAKQWKLIKNYFPKNTKGMWYIEPFFGGGSVGLNALNDNLFSKYIYSDIDEELMIFWDKFSYFIYYLLHIEESLFYPNVKKINEIEGKKITWLALNFLMNNNLTFNGQRWGTWTQQRLEQNWNLNKFERIKKCNNLVLQNRKKNIIEFWNEDYITVLENTLCNNSFYYLDPPYFKNKGKPYRHKFKKPDWNLFIKWLKNITEQGSYFCLSIDDCPETRKMFQEYNIHSKEWKYTSSNTNGNKKCRLGKELIITNYEVDYEKMN